MPAATANRGVFLASRCRLVLGCASRALLWFVPQKKKEKGYASLIVL